MLKYYDSWRTDAYDCPKCHWEGPGSELQRSPQGDDVFALICPACRLELELVTYPTLNESRANWDKLSESERKEVEAIEHRRDEFARRKLNDGSPLPDITEPIFTLEWDTLEQPGNSVTYIKYRSEVIFTEPAVYEGCDRFVEVAEILRRRYGAALVDLVPSARSELYLYGDRYGSGTVVREARQRIFGKG